MPDAASEPAKTSPLDDLPGCHGGIKLTERRFVGKVNVRGDAADAGFTEAVKSVVGSAPPTNPNTVASAADYTVFWLGPDEWQIHCGEDRQRDLVSGLREVLKDKHAAVVDVSDYYVVMRLAGKKALEVLSKGTPLDLHPRVFPPDRCAQTVFGHATVLLHKLDEETVDLQVRWSFAEYVWFFIVDGTLEYRSSPA